MKKTHLIAACAGLIVIGATVWLVTPGMGRLWQGGVVSEAVAREGEVELRFTGKDGKAWAAYVKQHDASVFLQSSLRYIDEQRDATKAKLDARITSVFADAFHDRETSISAYADWYYGYFTSMNLAGHGVWGGIKEISSLDVEQMRAAVSLAVQDEIRQNFMNHVLKPELRDAKIQDGVRAAILGAHRDYQRMIEGLDGRLITFITDHARYVTPIDTTQKVKMTLDWDSESWRAPLHYDREAVLMGAGGVMMLTGLALAGDVVAEAGMVMLGTVIGEATLAAEVTAGGAAVGTEVMPGLGTAIGAGAGLAMHGAINLFREQMGRDQFIKDSNAALNATIDTWRNMMTPKAHQLVDRWFNETKKLVQTPDIEGKVGT